MKRYKLVAKGRVQGVGFRYFVQSTAIKGNLLGWVRNLNNGDVEIEIQGLDGFIDDFYKIIKKGNFFSKVEELIIEEIEVDVDCNKFKVKY